MKKFTISLVSSLVLSAFLATTAVADKKDYSMLKSGFMAVIFPVEDGGQSIALKLDDQGFTACASQLNPVDGVIPAPTHCNVAITPVGFHIPPEVLFGSNNKFWNGLKIAGKVALAAAPLALGAFTNLGVTSEVGQAAVNVLSPNPIEIIQADSALPSAFQTLIHFGQVTTQTGKGTIAVAFVSNRYADLLSAFQDRVGKITDHCNKAPQVQGNYCYDQMMNMVRNINFDAFSNTPMQPTNVGEPGQGEIATQAPSAESVENAMIKAKTPAVVPAPSESTAPAPASAPAPVPSQQD